MQDLTKDNVSIELERNVASLKEILGNPDDLIVRQFKTDVIEAAVCFIDELVNKDQVNEYVIKAILENVDKLDDTLSENGDPLSNSYESEVWPTVVNQLVKIGEIKEIKNMREVVDALLGGNTVLFVNGCKTALYMGTKGWVTKGIADPKIESVIRGPSEALNETIVISLSMIRRRLKDHHLRLKKYKKGERSGTGVMLLYLDDIIDPQLIENIDTKLNQIKIDAVMDIGYIEELVKENQLSPFPEMQYTERPDNVVAHLLEGKFAILVDGSPNALIAPAVFTQFYTAAEDYYERSIFSSLLRIVRFIALIFSLFLPSIYIALISFHLELIPPKLAISVASSRANVPFSSILEIIFMELGALILSEASIRIPAPLGSTIGIVGALVIGNAAVSAGIVSPSVIIVVALTIIASYASPSYNASWAIRLVRYGMIGMVAFFGLYGVAISSLLLFLHLLNLKSFGVPYLSPILPFTWADIKDTWWRAPWKFMNKRPRIFRPKDKIRLQGGEEH